MRLAKAQERIRERLEEGGSLAEVERELIDPSRFTEEHKAALCLFAAATRTRLPREKEWPEATELARRRSKRERA